MANIGESIWFCRGGVPPAPCDPVTIVQQPTGVEICCTNSTRCASFSVMASGTAPLSYQWYINGGIITGATASAYTLCPLTLADNGNQYTVKITNACGSVTSQVATLTVRLDTNAPVLTCPADLVVCADPGQTSKSNVTYAVTTADNCPGVNFSCDPSSGTTFSVGTTPVICVAIDAAGNSNRCVFTVTVNANTAAVPLSSLTRCRGDTATYTAVTSGGGALSYGWTVDGSPIGTDSPVLVVATGGLTDGNHTVQCIASGECGTVTNRATLTVQSCIHGGPCTVTQGFVANSNGKFNGTRSITMSSNLLANAPLVVGKAGVRSLTISQSAVPLLVDRMPAGGTPATLPNSGDQNLLTAVLPLKKGKLDNILLGQVITLSLYTRLDSSLSTFPLRTNFCTEGVSAGPDGSLGTADDVPVSGDVQMFAIPNSVLAALADAGLGINDVTVRGLVELANRALAALPTAGASLPDINSAVDNINRGFDFCRVLVDCTTHIPLPPSPNDSFGNPIPLGGAGGGSPNLGIAPAAGAAAVANSVTARILRTHGFNCEAGKEPDEPDIAGNAGGKSVWWKWRATVSGLVTIQTRGSSFDTLLAVYVGPSLANLTLIAASDDTPGLVTAEVTFTATAGTDYLIAVDGFDGGCGSIELELITGAPRLGQVRVLPGGGFMVGIEGELGRSYVVEGSSDLAIWAPVAAVQNNTGTLHFVDRQARTSNQRFYRVVLNEQ